MRKTRTQASSTAPSSRRVARPDLKLVRGGAACRAPSSAAGAPGAGVRDGVVERARTRLAAGYYERPQVQRRLVDCLWEEFFAR